MITCPRPSFLLLAHKSSYKDSLGCNYLSLPFIPASGSAANITTLQYTYAADSREISCNFWDLLLIFRSILTINHFAKISMIHEVSFFHCFLSFITSARYCFCKRTLDIYSARSWFPNLHWCSITPRGKLTSFKEVLLSILITVPTTDTIRHIKLRVNTEFVFLFD